MSHESLQARPECLEQSAEGTGGGQDKSAVSGVACRALQESTYVVPLSMTSVIMSGKRQRQTLAPSAWSRHVKASVESPCCGCCLTSFQAPRIVLDRAPGGSRQRLPVLRRVTSIQRVQFRILIYAERGKHSRPKLQIKPANRAKQVHTIFSSEK